MLVLVVFFVLISPSCKHVYVFLALHFVGIIEKIQQIPCNKSRQIKQRYVCSPVDHFISQSYNCGFRNLQMLLSCLINDAAYLRHVFSGILLFCCFWMILHLFYISLLLFWCFAYPVCTFQDLCVISLFYLMITFFVLVLISCSACV